MGNDLPDFQSQVIGAGLEATSFRSGLDADKPASPAAGDIYLARDTFYLYVCNAAGSWEKVAKLYLLLAGGTMSGAIAMGSNKITGLAAPTASADAARKSEVDTVDAKLDDVTWAEPVRVKSTIYQNTGGKIRVVTINGALTGTGILKVLLGSATPPTTIVHRFDNILAYEGWSVCIIVPPNYYYEALEDSATVSIGEWHEWDLF